MAHALDPDNTPLNPEQAAQFNRVVQAAKLLDSYPYEFQVVNLMKAKYNKSLTQLRNDVAIARELFKTRHTFDYDFWHAWEIQDQVELIKRCRDKDDYKNWNAAKKHLRDIIGVKPEAVDDPKRMERNIFYIQVNNSGGQPVNIPIEQLKQLNEKDRKVVLDSLATPIDADDAYLIFNS